MNNIPRNEAESLLSTPLRCEDCTEWTPIKLQPGSVAIETGIVNEMGVGTGLSVRLDYKNSPKTKIIRYQFSVFKRQPYGLDRVYQLTISQTPKLPKDLHSRSHEHMGDFRETGPSEWNSWKYDEVLDYFCRRTHIEFRPLPPHPEEFHLKG